MSTEHVLGPDIDLDTEDIRNTHGRRIAETRAAELAEDALVKVLIQASLTAPTSPRDRGPRTPGTP